MSDQPTFTFGPRSADAIAAALASVARWGGNKKLHDAVTLVLESYVELLEAAKPAPGMHLVGWLLKWDGWQETALLEEDEDPRTKAWGDEPPVEIIDLYAYLQNAPKPPPRKIAGRVTLRQDWEGVPRGSSLANLRDLGEKWLCDWPTPGGTISDLEVPKSLCTEPKGES
ncbi:hypothetical protein J2W32_004427 [Variovorax boronicumulans]|uniref:DUF551 domain-containing protein n=1 Tax=Variovorax boronicumulans TaxID=436515 RepID=A0AAW8CXZ8_9BURK|nr:hypothetical protein [Variovorax boronicumulans]MDP9895329.1 hypothetical protein [Variovorax boronicumulans]MDQ0055369.1 hypothetical protein [Variovorax boronicumulans]